MTTLINIFGLNAQPALNMKIFRNIFMAIAKYLYIATLVLAQNEAHGKGGGISMHNAID